MMASCDAGQRPRFAYTGSIAGKVQSGVVVAGVPAPMLARLESFRSLATGSVSGRLLGRATRPCFVRSDRQRVPGYLMTSGGDWSACDPSPDRDSERARAQ